MRHLSKDMLMDLQKQKVKSYLDISQEQPPSEDSDGVVDISMGAVAETIARTADSEPLSHDLQGPVEATLDRPPVRPRVTSRFNLNSSPKAKRNPHPQRRSRRVSS